jgi:hypothetical protein
MNLFAYPPPIIFSNITNSNFSFDISNLTAINLPQVLGIVKPLLLHASHLGFKVEKLVDLRFLGADFRRFGAVKGFHHIAHILFVGNAVGGFLRKADKALEITAEFTEKLNPGRGLQVIAPDDRLNRYLGL